MHKRVLESGKLAERVRLRAMTGSTKAGRKRGDLPVEPLSFSEMSEEFKEKIREREPHLKSAGLWEFVTQLEIPWPWPADLSEFVLSAGASNFREVRVRNQLIRLEAEAIAQVTTLPGVDSGSVAEACRAIDAPEWGVVFEDGQSAFDVRKQGWDLKKALPPWRDWLLLIHQRIELERDGNFMEHCVVCAALAAWIRGTKFNWAEEVRLRIREEVEKGKCLRPVPLRSAGYIGMLCQLSFSPSTTSATRRSVAPFLAQPTGFVIEEPMPPVHSPLSSPEPPVILEEYVKLHGESPEKFESRGFCLPWREESSMPAQMQATEREWHERMAKVTRELESQKKVVERQQEQLEILSNKTSQLTRENLDLRESVTKLSENLHQSEGEKSKWQEKHGETETFNRHLLREREEWEKSKSNFTKEKSEWLSLKERQERAIASKAAKVKDLEAQIRTFLIDERTIMDLQQEVTSLKSLTEVQSETVESLKGRVERLRSGLWAIESACPPYNSLYKNYELQRDVFFIVNNLKPSQVLEPTEFERLWEESVSEGYENLLTEILVRGELKLQNLFKGFQIIADLGVHVFLYYSQLELSLSKKRQLVSKAEASQPTRHVNLQQWNQAVGTAMAICPPALLQPWQTELARLSASLGNDIYLQTVMDAASERLAIGKQLDIGAGQYQLKFDQISERLTRSLQTISQPGGRIQVQLQNQVTFFLPPANLVQRMLQSTRRPPISPLAHQFLGNYSALFDFDIEEPIPSWKAFDWIFEDVGLSRQISTRPEEAHDVVYRSICHGWSPMPPVTVTNDPRFCDCPRRWKWPPQALIDSLEYNWPLIPGRFVTAQDCYESYMQFSYEHREHQDPVCFRAAIFTAILGFWCKKYDFVYNVNLLSKANREAMFLTKINYNSARWYRCLEAMCATYFIIGPHHSLVNEFGATRYGVISRALKNQRLTLNTVIPQEEVMAPGYVEDYGPSSQRQHKKLGPDGKRQKR